MRVLVFMALVQTYACDPPSRPRSVNLALETIVEFDNNDNSADIQIIDKVRSFLDRVKFVIDNNHGKGSRRSLQGGNLKFSDFVKNALVILVSYKDSDLEDVMSVVDDEIRKYHYKGCKFHELVENSGVRRFMANNLEKMKNAPAKDVKVQIRKMLDTFENNNYGLMQKVVMDYVDSLYGGKSEAKFRDLLNKLDSYKSRTKRSNLNLVKVVRDGIRSVVFDHYSGLDIKTRRNLKLKLETFWQDLSHPGKNLHYTWNLQPPDGNDKKIERSNEKFRDADNVGSSSLEVHTTKRSRHNHGQDNAKRQRGEHSTRRRLTFITLYPEEITILEKRKHKKKSTKSFIAATYLRKEKPKSKSKNKKKNKAFRKIVSEHEAVINVARETIDRPYPAYDELLDYKSRQITQWPMKRAKMTPKSLRAISSKKRSSIHRKQEKTIRPRHETKTKKVMNIPIAETEEGLSISFEERDLVKKSFRKSNVNDTLFFNATGTNETAETIETTDNPTLSITTSDGNVIKRINNLEKELRVVQAQIKVTTADSHERTHYEHIDFWEGTPKKARDTTPKSTTETTTTEITTTTTAEPETTTTTVDTTAILTTEVVGSTFGAVFRSQLTNESDSIEKGSVNQENKSENKIAETKDDTERNMTRVIPVSQDNFDDPLKLNNSAEMDYLNDVKEPEVNITGIEDIERYLNKSNPIGDGKNDQIARNQMLQQLKGIFSENPEDDPRNKAFYSSTPSTLLTDQDLTTDALNFLDVGDDI